MLLRTIAHLALPSRVGPPNIMAPSGNSGPDHVRIRCPICKREMLEPLLESLLLAMFLQVLMLLRSRSVYQGPTIAILPTSRFQDKRCGSIHHRRPQQKQQICAGLRRREAERKDKHNAFNATAFRAAVGSTCGDAAAGTVGHLSSLFSAHVCYW